MNDRLTGSVGRALGWKAVQLGADRVVTLVRFLILARILAPEDFGLLAIATVTLELLLTLTDFGMVPALVQRRNAESKLYDAAWTVGILRGVAVAVVVVAGAPLIAQLFDDPRSVNLIRLIALRPLLAAFVSMRIADLERDLDFRSLAMLQLPAAVLQTLVAVGLAPLIGVYALVAGMLVGTVLQVALSYRLAPYRPRLQLHRAAAAPLFRYGRWILATSVAGMVGEAVLRVLVSRLLGTADLGLYYLAARLVSIPNGVVSLVVGAVAFPLHVRLQERVEPAVQALRANLTALLATLVPIYIGLIALAPALVRDVLGQRWAGTVAVIQILAVAPILGVVADAVIPLFQGRGRPQHVTGMILVRSSVLLVVVWPLTAVYGLAGAALAVAVSEVPTQLLGGLLARRLLPAPFRTLWKPTCAALLASVAAGGIARAVDSIVGPPVGLFAAVAAAVPVGLVLLAWLDRLLGVGLFRQLTRVFPMLSGLPLLRRVSGGS